jgi:hypothetical protein
MEFLFGGSFGLTPLGDYVFLPECLGTSALHRDQSPRLLPNAERNRNRLDVDLIALLAFVANPVKLPVEHTTQSPNLELRDCRLNQLLH